MNKDEKLTVVLLKQTTLITLPLDPAKALDHFMEVGKIWASWSQLLDAGVSNPGDAVRALQKQGALIQTMYKHTVTSEWDIHNAAPNYKYCGWHFDEASPPNITTSAYKELV
jgi:hypothetical protein